MHRKQFQNTKIHMLHQFGTKLHPCCSSIFEITLCQISRTKAKAFNTDTVQKNASHSVLSK